MLRVNYMFRHQGAIIREFINILLIFKDMECKKMQCKNNITFSLVSWLVRQSVSQYFTFYTIDGRVHKRWIRKDSVGRDRGLIEVLTQYFPRLAEKNQGSIVCVPWPPTEHKSRALPLNKSAVPIQPEHTDNRWPETSIKFYHNKSRHILDESNHYDR